METSNLSLAYSVAELKQKIEGTFLNSVQQVNENVFKFKFHSKQYGALEVIASPNALYQTNYKLKVQETQSGFAAYLKKQLYNKRVLVLEQHGFDRIVEMRFSEHDLVFELFAKGNVIFKDKNEKILSCYKSEEWKDRIIKRNEQYKYPASKPSIVETSPEEFKKILAASEQDCVRAIVSALNVAPIAAEEACLLANIEKQKKSNSLSGKQVQELFKQLKILYLVDLKRLKPIVIEGEKGELQLLPFEFSSAKPKSTRDFATMSEAFDEFVSKEFAIAEATEQKKGTDQKKARLEYSRQEQEAAKLRIEQEAVESRRKAELIYENYAEISELFSALKKAVEKKENKKDIMYKIKIAGEKGNKAARLLVDFDPKTKRLVLDLPSN